MFEFSAGAASTSGQEMFWREEGLHSGNNAVKRRGNLYIVAEGSPSECAVATKAIRDEYYGNLDQPQGGIIAALRQSMEAANAILAKKRGLGVSCVCAAVTQ